MFNGIIKMKIQLNSDKNIQGNEKFEAYVSEKINRSLKRFSDRITRVEVHLSDQNAKKASADDVHCKIEARVKDLNPVIVTGKSNTKEKALSDAVDKIKTSLGSVIGKLNSK
jgi:ribosomal subunit interface protein